MLCGFLHAPHPTPRGMQSLVHDPVLMGKKAWDNLKQNGLMSVTEVYKFM